MNIYKKIEICKKSFLETKIDKKGNNTFVKFKYFRLDELIPILIKTTEEQKLATNFTIKENKAILTIVNIEKPEEKIEYEAPFVFDEVGKNLTQEVGKSITYMRRYLLLMAFDIIEEEILDKELGKKEPKKETKIDLMRKEFNSLILGFYDGDKAKVKQYCDENDINKQTTEEELAEIIKSIKGKND